MAAGDDGDERDERADPTMPGETTDPVDVASTDVGEPAAAPSKVARVRALAERGQQKVAQTRDRLEGRRADSRTIDAVFGVTEHDEAIGGAVLAGAVAFRIFLFLVPMVFVLVAGLGLAADAAGRPADDVARSTGAAGLVARSIANVADASLGARVSALVVGSLALWLAARAALRVLRVVHGLVWRVPVPKLARPNRSVLAFIGICLGILVALRLISALLTGSQQGGFIGMVALVAIPTWLWLTLSRRAFPDADGVGRRALLPGALLVGAGLSVLHLFTVFWISRQVTTKTETYGAIGVALALLLWAYLLGRLLTAGAVVNASLWYRDHPAAPPPPADTGDSPDRDDGAPASSDADSSTDPERRGTESRC